MDRQAQMRNYLTQKINPVFEKLIVDLLVDMPENFIEFSVDWLKTKGKQVSSGTYVDEKSGGPNIHISDKSKGQKHHKGSDSEHSEDDDYDEEEMLKQQAKVKKLQQSGQQRTSVSAEVYGTFNKKEDFKARVIPKSEDAKKRIRTKMDQAFMFSVLDEKEKEIVIGAMEEKKFKNGDWVIKQGEEGDVLYVIDSGNLDCFKKFSKDAKDTYLKTYQPGEAFGELALLYNAPRAASIQAKSDCILWALDRECFNVIVKDAARKKREKYEAVMDKVKILDELDPYEKSRLGDGVQDIKFSKGQFVCTQGQAADNFYIVAEGTLKATRSEKQGDPPKDCGTYKLGDYFGEVGLVHNIPRQANVIAETDVTLVYLNKEKFDRLLMPIANAFKKQENARYGRTY